MCYNPVKFHRRKPENADIAEDLLQKGCARVRRAWPHNVLQDLARNGFGWGQFGETSNA